ncbi:CHAT domain-containing protein [Aquimarina muelleri]|nr:CHAT domain-containing tetratricopeptide repeat protein [Aquimarina muelleri]MCX2762704.1 CHAT domain-containing protein [Aquimarina muelleri]
MKKTHSFSLFFIIYFSFLMSYSIRAQVEKDTILASQYFKKADSLLTSADYNNSIQLFKKAIPIYQKAKIWERVSRCYNKISENQWRNLKLKESLESSKKALAICDTYLTENHKEKASGYDNVGHYHRLSQNYDEALLYYNKALAVRDKLLPENHVDLIVSNTNLGIIYSYKTKYKIAIQYFEKAIDIRLKSLEPYHYNLGSLYSNLGILYDDLGVYNKSLEYYKKSLQIKIKKFGKKHNSLISTYNNIGVTYVNLKQFHTALNYYKKALEISVKKNNIGGLIKTYLNIGNVLNNMGEYDKAIDYAKKSLGITIKNFGEHYHTIGNIYNNLGIYKMNQEEFKTALLYYNKALQNLKSIFGENDYRVFKTLINIGNLYGKQKEYDLALKYLKRGLRIHKNIFEGDNIYITKIYESIGDVYFETRRYNEALLNYNKALTVIQDVYGENHVLTSDPYNYIARAYDKQQEYTKALSYFDKALSSNAKNTNVTDNKNNFDLEDYYHYDFLLESLFGKAKTLRLRYLHDNNILDLKKSLAIYKNIDTLIQAIRQSFTNYQDKVVFAKQAKEIYQEAIETVLLQKDPQALEQAFYYAEKSKANTLKELLNDADAKNYSGLPADLVVLEKELRINRSFYQSKITEELSNKEVDTSKIRDFENELFVTNRRQDSLTEILEKNYPKYYQLKYRNDIVSVTDIQQKLDDKTTLVSFFTGDSVTYAFIVSKKGISVQGLPTPKLTEQIQEFRKSIIAKDVQKHKKQAYALYAKLIAPIQDKLLGEELIMIPDGPLWHLNFEVLVSQKDDSNNPALLSYLLKDYAISYTNSATLLFTPFKESVQSKTLQECLAFSFSDSTNIAQANTMRLAALRDTGDDLPGTRKEIRAISNIIDGEYYYGSQAIESNFKKNAGKYNILHLALHGDVDNERPENSKLYFTKSKDTLEDNLLYGHELFALDIPAELTVLSACNTGSGKIAKGEGIMSLGTAFQYAGTKSLLLTSWEVSDQTTPEVMKYFYTNLKAGMNKAKALQQAKLQYLTTANINRTDPFYWGAFYLVGDSAPIPFQNNTLLYWAVAVLTLVLLGGLLWYRRKMKNT